VQEKKPLIATSTADLTGNHEVTRNRNQPNTDEDQHSVDVCILRQLLLNPGVAQVDAGQN
jgi:hypothetical protein